MSSMAVPFNIALTGTDRSFALVRSRERIGLVGVVRRKAKHEGIMDVESVKKYFQTEKGEEIAPLLDDLPSRFLEPLVLYGLRIDLIERGRVVCSMKIPRRLLNTHNSLHGGATATMVDLVGSAAICTMGAPTVGVSVEINVTYLDAAYADEDIEIEAKILRIGKAIAVVSVEFKNKKTGKVFARGRHTKYLAIGHPFIKLLAVHVAEATLAGFITLLRNTRNVGDDLLLQRYLNIIFNIGALASARV
ncbi:acyl-coenzyme A thioesterase 13-like [Senna tora]|uniref:Acyl-coenzyme A thioesterase 13-like n=1 Tax=Senna tora TaxID=362788 RepID=A0A834WXF3_9FABA|nr:acyl-coenzyme A thioesterase 13-like [Senna tora]